MSYLKKAKHSIFFKSAFIYAAVNGFVAIFPLLLIPLIMHYVSVAEFGGYVLFVISSKILFTLLSLGSIESIAREYSDGDNVFFAKFYSNSLLTSLLLSIFLYSLFYCFDTFIDLNESIIIEYFYLLVIVAFCQFVNNSLLAILQMDSNAVLYGIFKISLFVLEYIILFVLLIGFEMGVEGLIFSFGISCLIVCCLSVLYILKSRMFVWGYSFGLFKSSLRVSLPIIPHDLSGVILGFSDRLIIGNLLNAGAVGIYTVGYQFGQVVSLVDTAVNKAFIPWLYLQLRKSDRNIDLISKVCFLYVVFLLVVSILIGNAGSWFIGYFYSSTFIKGGNVAIWIALAFWIFGIYKLAAGFVFYSRKTKILSIVTPTTAVINIALSYFLIPINGIIGAAQATLISFIFLASILVLFSFNLVRKF